DARSQPHGAHGGTTTGLVFGASGFSFILFAALLGLRKKFPVWRLGRAQTWMRAHLWFSPLSLPLILFHGGFHFGGRLTTALMVLLIIVLLSGIAGAVLQQFLPRRMTRELPLETVYEQVDSIRAQLLDEADHVVTSVCGPLKIPDDGSPSSLG